MPKSGKVSTLRGLIKRSLFCSGWRNTEVKESYVLKMQLISINFCDIQITIYNPNSLFSSGIESSYIEVIISDDAFDLM